MPWGGKGSGQGERGGVKKQTEEGVGGFGPIPKSIGSDEEKTVKSESPPDFQNLEEVQFTCMLITGVTSYDRLSKGDGRDLRLESLIR